MIDRLRAGAEQATSRARDRLEEAQLKHDLSVAYGELGRSVFALIEKGVLSEARLDSGAERIRALQTELGALGL
mgnify:CR=1 FL=1